MMRATLAVLALACVALTACATPGATAGTNSGAAPPIITANGTIVITSFAAAEQLATAADASADDLVQADDLTADQLVTLLKLSSDAHTEFASLRAARDAGQPLVFTGLQSALRALNTFIARRKTPAGGQQP